MHGLALEGVDLTIPAEQMTMQVISAVAEFERDVLLECSHTNIVRAKASGMRYCRPPAQDDEKKKVVLRRLSEGTSINAFAREFNTSCQAISE